MLQRVRPSGSVLNGTALECGTWRVVRDWEEVQYALTVSQHRKAFWAFLHLMHQTYPKKSNLFKIQKVPWQV